MITFGGVFHMAKTVAFSPKMASEILPALLHCSRGITASLTGDWICLADMYSLTWKRFFLVVPSLRRVMFLPILFPLVNLLASYCSGCQLTTTPPPHSNFVMSSLDYCLWPIILSLPTILARAFFINLQSCSSPVFVFALHIRSSRDRSDKLTSLYHILLAVVPKDLTFSYQFFLVLSTSFLCGCPWR